MWWEHHFSAEKHPIPIRMIESSSSLGLSAFEQSLLKAQKFQQIPGNFALVFSETGEIKSVLYVVQKDLWEVAKLTAHLPEGDYVFVDETQKKEGLDLGFASMAFLLSLYRFDHFVSKPRPSIRLKLPEKTKKDEFSHLLEAIISIRDWINLPAESFGPEELQSAMERIAAEFAEDGAELKGFIGEDLLQQNFPAIHAVGRASPRAPRLLHLSFGNPKHPVVCLVGKGVCFDTGGLNIKPDSGMAWMKKDMGGAAHAIALGRLIMRARLPVRLHVIVPAVDNAISGNSYRPGDVIPTRKGLFIEIVNTDAEGRVILSDALTYAEEQNPDWILDFATLTGAARVALGPELPVVYANEKIDMPALIALSQKTQDYAWPLPLHAPYQDYFKSDIADMANASAGSYAGSITAALFLQYFVSKKTPWIHVDLMAWNPQSKPGRPKGGEAQTLRLFYRWIQFQLKEKNG